MFDGSIEWRRRWKTEEGTWKVEYDEEGSSTPGIGCGSPYFGVPADSPSFRFPYDR